MTLGRCRDGFGVVMIPSCVTRNTEPANIKWQAVVPMGGGNSSIRCAALLTGSRPGHSAISDSFAHLFGRDVDQLDSLWVSDSPLLIALANTIGMARLPVRTVSPMPVWISCQPAPVVRRSTGAAWGSPKALIACLELCGRLGRLAAATEDCARARVVTHRGLILRGVMGRSVCSAAALLFYLMGMVGRPLGYHQAGAAPSEGVRPCSVLETPALDPLWRWPARSSWRPVRSGTPTTSAVTSCRFRTDRSASWSACRRTRSAHGPARLARRISRCGGDNGRPVELFDHPAVGG